MEQRGQASYFLLTSRPFCHRKVSTRKVLGLERRVRRIFFSYRSFLFGLMLCTCSYAVYMFAVCINLLLYWPHGGRWSRLTSHWPGHICSFHGSFEPRWPVSARYGHGPMARISALHESCCRRLSSSRQHSGRRTESVPVRNRPPSLERAVERAHVPGPVAGESAPPATMWPVQ